MEEKNQKEEQEKKECPLCEVSEDTIKKLKEQGREIKKETKMSWRFKIGVLMAIVISGGFILYQLFPEFSLSLLGRYGERDPQKFLSIVPGFSKLGEFAPEFISEDVYGNKVSLSDFRDKKPVLLVFWATWCDHSAQELRDLKAFTEEYRDEVQVIAVDSEESGETIKNYIKKKDINFLMLLDEDLKIWYRYSVRGTPTHFFISKQGKILAFRSGVATKESLEALLTTLK